MRKPFLIVLSFVFLMSCKKENNSRTDFVPEPDKDVREKLEAKKALQAKLIREFKFLEPIENKYIPLKDSTNFDNYNNKNKLTEAQIKLLSLKKIVDNIDITEIFVNYKLYFSRNFNTIIVSYYKNEQELSTVLINYTKNWQYIDSHEIAYDEIAESLVRVESEISKNKIVVTEKMYGDEAEEVTKTNYEIDAKGLINLVKQK